MVQATTAAQSRQQTRRLLAGEEEPGILRRLLQRFQQRVGGGIGQQSGIANPHHFRPTEARALIELFIDIAHRINAQRTLALFGDQRIVIGMCAGLHQLATMAVAAAFMSFGLAAHQEAAQRVNQRLTAHPAQRL